MKLPLLQFAAEQYPSVKLDRAAVIACQHILPTTFDLFEELFEKRLKPENVFLIGKCYSTNRQTFERFQKVGVNISYASFAFDSHISFDGQLQANTEKFFKKIRATIDTKSFAKIVILDDGAHLITFANDFVKDFSNVIAVEQTSSGYEKIKSVKLNFPVINVARSKAKLEVESPFISEIVVRKIEEYLQHYGLKNPNILIIGTGYIGTAISAMLKKKYLVSGCDIIEQKCDFGGDYKSHLREFDLIIGATGISAIQPGEFGLLKEDVLLASASSSDREFSAVYLRQLAPKTDNCHEDIKVNGTVLLNCGFPINFNDGQESEARENIQLTRSLLLIAVLEAATKTLQRGVIDLDMPLQERLIEKFKSLQAERAF